MTEQILTLRLKKSDLDAINKMLKLGKYRSRSQLMREALQLLRERESSASMKKLVSSRTPKPSVTLEEICKELEGDWTSKGESGELVDASRER